MYKPEISILLPFFENGEELDIAIQSILAQTFGNFELLLVNNNAASIASSIAAKHAENDSRIRLLFEKRQGISFALNTGIAAAKAEIVARMDADDISDPQRLEKQFAFLYANPSIDVVASQTEFRSKINKAEGYSYFVDWQNGIITPDQHALARFRESPLAHPTVMFRKKLIDDYGPYSTGALPEDYELWLRWMNEGVRFYKIPEKLLTWNDHIFRLSRQHENYSKEAFYTIKCHYLARWLKKTLPSEKKVVIFGASKIVRKRGDLLQANGVEIFGYTDVSPRRNRNINFMHIDSFKKPDEWFLISFIGKRGIGEMINRHFTNLGFIEGRDFILAA